MFIHKTVRIYSCHKSQYFISTYFVSVGLQSWTKRSQRRTVSNSSNIAKKTKLSTYLHENEFEEKEKSKGKRTKHIDDSLKPIDKYEYNLYELVDGDSLILFSCGSCNGKKKRYSKRAWRQKEGKRMLLSSILNNISAQSQCVCVFGFKFNQCWHEATASKSGARYKRFCGKMIIIHLLMPARQHPDTACVWRVDRAPVWPLWTIDWKVKKSTK